MNRLATWVGGVLLALGLWSASTASRFEPTTSAQLAAGFASCRGAAGVGTVLTVTGANVFGCVSTGTIRSAAADPTATNVPSGQWVVWTNTNTGRTSLWANPSGTPTDVVNAPEF